MLKTKNSLGSNENLKGEVYYRIVPMTVKLTSQLIDPTAKWLLYLQKGMQIIGKTDTFEIASPQGEYTFESSLNTNANKFDFQIVALQKNSSSNTEIQRQAIPQKFFTYTWSLYSLDNEDMEERIVAENFSIRDHYQKYLKESAREGYDLTANLKFFTLSFKLFIQNTSANITELVNGVIPENQDDVTKALVGLSKKGDAQVKERNRISSMISMEREREKEKQRQVRSAVVEKAPEQTPPTRQLKKVSLKIQPDQPQPQPESQLEPQSQPPKQALKYPNLEGSKIDEVQSQTSSLPTDSRRRIESRGDSLNLNIDQGDEKLEAIYEDREREDLVTPHANDFRPGSFNQAIAEIVAGDGDGELPTGQQFKKEKEEGNNENGNQIRQQNTEPLVYQSSTPTPDPEQEPKTSPQKKSKTPEPLPDLSLPLTPTDTGMKFKKLIIVFLLLVLVAGIVGTALMSGGKVKDLEEEEEKPTTTKGKKKGKKTKGKL